MRGTQCRLPAVSSCGGFSSILREETGHPGLKVRLTLELAESEGRRTAQHATEKGRIKGGDFEESAFLEQFSAAISKAWPADQIQPAPVFVNKVLLGDSRAHPFMCGPWLFSGQNSRIESL